MRGISKRFGDTQALSEASLVVLPGEIHALLGENGAGKSTLVSIAAGRLAADAGEILRGGRHVRFARAKQAWDAGVALVPQHDLLVGAASVADNLALLDRRAALFESARARRARVARLAEAFGLELGGAGDRVDTLPVGTRQRIEIAGALAGEPDVLILDEPTAVLSPDETAALFVALRRRAAAGAAIVLITHRLAEVFAGADRLTLLSRGRTVKTCPIGETTAAEIGGLLIAGSGEEARGRKKDEKEKRKRRFSWKVKSAESGSGGVEAHPAVPTPLDLRRKRRVAPHPSVPHPPVPHSPSRKRALAQTLTSVASPRAAHKGSKSLFLFPPASSSSSSRSTGTAPTRSRPRSRDSCPSPERSAAGGAVLPPAGDPLAFRAAGGAFVPADRREEGLVLDLDLAENLALPRPPGRFLLDRAAMRESARARIAAFAVRAPSPSIRAGALSGGNQQKLVLARELAGSPRVVVAIHPTRGLDLAASAAVRARLAAACAAGASVLVATSDPDEAFLYGGAVRVVTRGSLSENVPPGTPSAALGRLMAGLPA